MKKANRVIGYGRVALRFNQEDWIRQLGEYGEMVYQEIQSLKYVEASKESDTFYYYSNCLIS